MGTIPVHKMKRFRDALTHMIPWVTVLAEPRDTNVPKCQAYKRRPLKLHFRPLTPEEEEKYRCKHRARYRFRPLKNSYARSGDFCGLHLRMNCIFGEMAEEARYERWARANRAQINVLRAKYGLPPMPTQEELDALNQKSA